MYIDTHTHLSGEEFDADRDEVVARAKAAGCEAMLLPAIDMPTLPKLIEVCRRYPHYCFPMIGLHPEEVRDDWQQAIHQMEQQLPGPFVAIGEIGLDYYWSREYSQQQLAAFERQVQLALKHSLPLMIHCRKAQNEMVAALRSIDSHGQLTGVFHCFTGNAHEAQELLSFPGFCLGIGGVLTFKKSHLPEVLPAAVPLDRIVLETDAPYMAPVPMRGQRNESAYIPYVAQRLADSYGVTLDEVYRITTRNARQLFSI